ncbi:hypothetical protein [Arthrobacter sp. StoSoilB13]|uniref:hypothetical protein n=1 Tax=Arthrobacter sp. StoSoilB13 TaxID=2830993 RepID=UPI001CC76D13|nr:hypothetical protein [Arthrobacter sp. StoSoilB13]BCW47944.1 hypothetical protein StoSoilB13_02860 [Arthrobacter sp. StoSoilB13]
MSRHLELVPANDLVSGASVFNRDMLLSNTTTTEHERRAAAKYLAKNAPDLRQMILGNIA